ncbi:hypothetical protein NSQ62_07725 [Solibacillus sp. FSL H8-0523]|uniref:hypothetical protein n=1 Tax=Solibacillus sp. FSL H8-0523 TaxID=2954511 RepID=UPI003101B2EE
MENDCNKTELISRIVKLEERDISKERSIKKLEKDTEALNRLAIIAELHQKSLDSINQALLKISESNQVIAYEVQGLKDDIAVVMNDVDKVTIKVENIEAADTINIPKSFKKAMGWFFSAIIAGVASYIFIKLNMK